MKQTRLLISLCSLLLLLALAPEAVNAEERTLTPEQLKALSQDGELGADTNARPTKLPDLTKGEPAGDPGKHGVNIWPLGPTGMFGHMVGGLTGDQIEVSEVQPGSPAEGKMRWGDVILGVNGTRFSAGQNMGMLLGKEIIQSERAINKGQLKLIVWRDKNMLARNKKKDIAGADVDALFDKAENDDSLYDWKPKEEQANAVRSSNYKEFPIDAQVLEVTLQLEVMPDYSDTSPYDCPKAKRILENAWKVLEKQFAAGKIRADRSGALAALALVASGKPEHRALVRNWVRSPKAKNWHPEIGRSFDIMRPAGYQSWRMSFDGLDAAVYYDATGDDFVLPAIRAYAVFTAQGQAGGGSWGHTFAWPAFNGGELHGMNPGYGALNYAGNRCFMLLALAKKLGIEHPEIDQAIERSSVFFCSYYEKGAIPYGHHGAAGSDDSNGKNVGVAFAFKLLGDKQKAKWFAQMSSHASFTRRGGHGSGYLWHYTPWAATMTGPRATIASHRNLRWRFTLCRQFDGSFTCHSNYGKENLRNPTATYVMHYSAPMKQTLFTGKDADESMFWSDKEFDQLMASAYPQLNDEKLIEEVGTPWKERNTDELFDLLSIFMPKARRIYATELGRRYQAGEKDIVPRLATLLKSDNPRLRAAACRGLDACGGDATLKHLSAVVKLLKDDQEFVRIQAAKALHGASDSMDAQLALIKATIANDESKTKSPNSLGAFMQTALFTGESPLAHAPFDTEIDGRLVEQALAKLIVLDPAGNRPMLGKQNKVWDKQTVVRIAGPLVYAAEQEQIADQMFSSRRPATLALLERHGYQEAVDAAVSYLHSYNAIDRPLRRKVYYKRGNVDAKLLMRHPGAAKRHLDAMYRWLLDKPLDMAFVGKDEPSIPLYQLIKVLEAAEQDTSMPSLGDDVQAFFRKQLTEAGSNQAKVALCQAELEDPARRNYFRKIAAMRGLVERVAPEDVFADIMPYLSHDHWRVEQAARALMVGLVKAHGVAPLATAMTDANEGIAVGVLNVLAKAKPAGAAKIAEDALSHASPAVRAQAVQTLVAIKGAAALNQVFAVMDSASDKKTLLGCELALQTLLGDRALADRVQSESAKRLSSASPMLRETLFWLLGQCGGSQALATLQQAAETATD